MKKPHQILEKWLRFLIFRFATIEIHAITINNYRFICTLFHFKFIFTAIRLDYMRKGDFFLVFVHWISKKIEIVTCNKKIQ